MKSSIFNILFFILLLLATNLGAQGLENILRQKTMDEIKARIQELEKDERQTATVLFLKAAIESDGKIALSLYEQVLQNYPKSSYADDARLKIGQYYFMLGVFSLAEEQFRELIRQYPNSPLRDGAAYYIAQCYIAMERKDDAKKALLQFINQFRQSNLIPLAVGDLKRLDGQEMAQVPPSRPDEFSAKPPKISKVDEKPTKANPGASPETQEPAYSIQVGAFLKSENAERQQAYFKEHGYQAEVLTKQMDGKFLYVVCINRFSSFEAAVEFGKKLNQKYRVSFQVIQLDNLK
jgi:tetratricopeptide (TPR) repeat protein